LCSLRPEYSETVNAQPARMFIENARLDLLGNGTWTVYSSERSIRRVWRRSSYFRNNQRKTVAPAESSKLSSRVRIQHLDVSDVVAMNQILDGPRCHYMPSEELRLIDPASRHYGWRDVQSRPSKIGHPQPSTAVIE